MAASSSWDLAYREGRIPWHSDAPHHEIVRLVESRRWRPGKILDIGCGLASNLLWLSGRGFETWGVDISAEAIRQARERTGRRVRLLVRDALDVASLGETFDYVLDMGCYHLHDFPAGARQAYPRVVHSVLRPDGEFLLMCFSPKEPPDWGGPRRVSKEELETTFGPWFELLELLETRWHGTDEAEGPWSWMARWRPRTKGLS